MIKKFKNLIFITFIFTLFLFNTTFAAKYTIANGKDFNTRIKAHLNKDFTSATPEYTITGFKYSSSLDGTPIDISEDGDSSVLAYIKNNIPTGVIALQISGATAVRTYIPNISEGTFTVTRVLESDDLQMQITTNGFGEIYLDNIIATFQ